MRVFGFIMAGGGGTRFWPLSRINRPKQLLNITGNDLMINETIDRLLFTIPANDIFIVTNAEQVNAVKNAVRNRIPECNVLSEPCARDTAACVGYAAEYVKAHFGDGIMLLTPSDAYIADVPAFSRTLQRAVQAVESLNRMLTIGITPDHPATGYGYIAHTPGGKNEVQQVLAFKEKPLLEQAEAFMREGSYKWNSGMFIWRASKILEQFKILQPEMYEQLETIGSAIGTAAEAKTIQDVYPRINRISVDYAIMEQSAKAGEVIMVEGDFGWSDIGCWDAMSVVRPTDKQGNVAIGDDIEILDSKNCVACTNGKPVILMGISDTVIVETDDVLLVCARDRAQQVKQITEHLKQIGRGDLL